MENEIINALLSKKNFVMAKNLSRFFKTGKGEYSEGDIFWGINIPTQRAIAKEFINADLLEIESVLASLVHEQRMTALLILLYQVKRAKKDETKKKEIFDFFLSHTKYVNNWDLVDVICRDIVGGYLLDKQDRNILYKLANSSDLWERRISIVSTYEFIRHGDFNDSLKIAKILLLDEHDLIHKAVGWMLREIFKRDPEVVRKFLKTNIRILPRVTLRYAIEKMSKVERKSFLSL